MDLMSRSDVWYSSSVAPAPLNSSLVAPLPSLGSASPLTPLSRLAPARYAPSPIPERPVIIETPVYSHPVQVSSGGVRIPGTVTTLGTAPSLRDLSVGRGKSSIGLGPTISPVSRSDTSLLTPGLAYTPEALPAQATYQNYDDSRLIGMATLGGNSNLSTQQTKNGYTTKTQPNPVSLGLTTKKQVTSSSDTEELPDFSSMQSYVDSIIDRLRVSEEESARNKAHLDLIARIEPPTYHFPIDSPDADLMFITLVYPTGAAITHAFDVREPLDTVLGQIQYDTRSMNQVELVVRGSGGVTCNPSIATGVCGLRDGQIIDVSMVDIE